MNVPEKYLQMNYRVQKRDILLVLLGGLLAAVINLFRLPLFFEAQFVFGPFIVLLIAVYRGPVVGLLTSIIATFPLTVAWGSYWASLTFGLEALFVGYFYGLKRINVVMLVMAYWVFIGMPISWYSISQYDYFLDSHRTTILIKQLINAILYAHLTALVLHLPRVKSFFSDGDTTPLTMRERSFHIISSLLISIGILFFFINLVQTIKNANNKFSVEHQKQHEETVAKVALVMGNISQAMNEFKYALGEVWNVPDKRLELLMSFNQRHPDFKTMLIANDQAEVIHSSPPELINKVTSENEPLNISDRIYYIEAINSNKPFISAGFIGRGFGEDLLTAISVGVPNTEMTGRNIGIVEGSYYLNSSSRLKNIIDTENATIFGILVDQNGKVLMASSHLGLDSLQSFDLQKSTDESYNHDLVSLLNEAGEVNSQAYYSVDSDFSWGWRLYTLQDEGQFVSVIEKSLLIFALSIILVVLISNFLARNISRSWSYYIHRLNKIIDKHDELDDLSEFETNSQLPQEVSNLYQEIKRSRLKIVSMNKNLQKKVAKRTEKLQKMNAQLNVIARRDALTKLHNRYAFNEMLDVFWVDCQKELIPFSMMVIDIDHFKKINDNFGHPVGDSVLIQLAKILAFYEVDSKQFVSRMGGEEFSILLKGSSSIKAADMAEKIRQQIEQTVFKVGLDKKIHITVSIGLATIDANELTAVKLYQLADAALYEAKESGRNQLKIRDK